MIIISQNHPLFVPTTPSNHFRQILTIQPKRKPQVGEDKGLNMKTGPAAQNEQNLFDKLFNQLQEYLYAKIYSHTKSNY